VLVLPPLIFVFVNGIADWRFPKAKMLVAGFILCSFILGIGSAYSDYKYADTYRNLASEIKQSQISSTVWYVGKWGMQYYMEKAGARYLLATSNDPRKGDLIIVPEMPRLWMPSSRVQVRSALVAERVLASSFPLRLFNRRSNAGFYCTVWGFLPFAFSGEPDEVFSIFKVMQDPQ
jgi:hypothetical protein